MSSYWRAAGLTYLQYVNTATRALRLALKEEAKVAALKREEQVLKYFKWENGQQGDMKYLGNDQKA